jgi:hypothetical protein
LKASSKVLFRILKVVLRIEMGEDLKKTSRIAVLVYNIREPV